MHVASFFLSVSTLTPTLQLGPVQPALRQLWSARSAGRSSRPFAHIISMMGKLNLRRSHAEANYLSPQGGHYILCSDPTHSNSVLPLTLPPPQPPQVASKGRVGGEKLKVSQALLA